MPTTTFVEIARRKWTDCRIADALLRDYLEAARDHSEAAIALSRLAGSKSDLFADAEALAARRRALCQASRLAMHEHFKEHKCRRLVDGVANAKPTYFHSASFDSATSYIAGRFPQELR